MPAMMPCDRCAGSGRVPRTQRRRDDGTPDPFDIVGQHRAVCDKCGGSGEMPAGAPASEHRKRGYVADLG